MIEEKNLLHFLLILMLLIAGVIGLSLRLMIGVSWLLLGWLLFGNNYVDSSHKSVKLVALGLA
jgi:uncharacterized protein YqgC (DUF456 family)